jgi:hypothetical protein
MDRVERLPQALVAPPEDGEGHLERQVLGHPFARVEILAVAEEVM